MSSSGPNLNTIIFSRREKTQDHVNLYVNKKSCALSGETSCKPILSLAADQARGRGLLLENTKLEPFSTVFDHLDEHLFTTACYSKITHPRLCLVLSALGRHIYLLMEEIVASKEWGDDSHP